MDDDDAVEENVILVLPPVAGRKAAEGDGFKLDAVVVFLVVAPTSSPMLFMVYEIGLCLSM
jgi:hypothetical protein